MIVTAAVSALFPHSSFLTWYRCTRLSWNAYSKVLQLLIATQLKVRSLSAFADPNAHTRKGETFFLLLMLVLQSKKLVHDYDSGAMLLAQAAQVV